MSEAETGDPGHLPVPDEVVEGLGADASELRQTRCPYCGTRYGSKRERDLCVASHFDGSDKIDRKGYAEDGKWSIIDEWRENL